MTINSEIITAGPFICNGVNTSFPFAFKFFTEHGNNAVAVYRRDAAGNVRRLTQVEYSLGWNNPNDGGVVFVQSPLQSVGSMVFIISNVPFLQTYNALNNSNFYAEALNTALDRIVIQILQLRFDVGRSLKVPLFDTRSPEDYLEAMRKEYEDLLNAAVAKAVAEATAAAKQSAAEAKAAELAAKSAAAAALASQNAAASSASNAAASATASAASAAASQASATAAATSAASALAAKLAAEVAAALSEDFRDQCLILVSTLAYGNFRGVWLPGETYAAGDCVMYDGAFWLALQNPTIGVPPSIGAVWNTVETVPKNSPEFTGVPKVPTASEFDYSKQIANTEWARRAVRYQEPMKLGWRSTLLYDAGGNLYASESYRSNTANGTQVQVRHEFFYDASQRLERLTVHRRDIPVGAPMPWSPEHKLGEYTFSYGANGDLWGVLWSEA
ncbi:MAG: hypothetical protein LBI35_02590 [Burkholderiales bacterium]|jgi:hypothetical protein|nr:hypothetical protein [Burkholderiales bacterium]